MDKTRAFHALVHTYPAGTKSLAAAMDMSVTTLLHKANPADVKQFFSPEEGMQLQELTGNVGPCVVECDRLGLLVFKRPKEGTEPVCAKAVNITVKEFSEFLGGATDALADNRITANELHSVERECLGAIDAIQNLLACITAMHERDKPAALRNAA